MATRSVETLLDEICRLGQLQYELVEAVRALVKSALPRVTEEVKYGGILFSSGLQFCGVFAYRQHVSVEFSHGAKIDDRLGWLEGRGQGRRHLKLYQAQDIQAKHLEQYLRLALEAAGKRAAA